MADRIRIIPHEAVPLCGSFEVRFPPLWRNAAAAGPGDETHESCADW
jgi:hypothetical protein